MSFKPGNGRKRGAFNKRTLLQRESLALLAGGDGKLPPRHERLKQLLLDPDPRVRLEVEKLLIHFEWQRQPVQLRAQADVNVMEATLRKVWMAERERVRGRPGSEAIAAQLVDGPNTKSLPAFDLAVDKGADDLPKAWEEDEWNPEPWRWIKKPD